MLDLKELIKKLVQRESVVGTVTSASKSINITSTNIDTYAEGATITLEPGVYIVTAYGSFTSNTTETNRRVQIFNKTGNSGVVTVSNWDRWYCAHTTTHTVVLAVSSVLAVRLSAGVALNSCGTYIEAIRIA